MKTITDEIKSFFSSLEPIKNAKYFVFREDGILVYNNLSNAESTLGINVGVLMGGAWQAAKALIQYMPGEFEEKKFRFSYDLSDSGVYILGLETQKEPLYFGVLYLDEKNPGQLKQKLRNICGKLDNFLLTKTYKNSEKTINSSHSEYLFDEISDAEMDNIFSFIGN